MPIQNTRFIASVRDPALEINEWNVNINRAKVTEVDGEAFSKNLPPINITIGKAKEIVSSVNVNGKEITVDEVFSAVALFCNAIGESKGQ